MESLASGYNFEVPVSLILNSSPASASNGVSTLRIVIFVPSVPNGPSRTLGDDKDTVQLLVFSPAGKV